MDIQLKRAYDDVESGDGTRILVDRMWPRGVSKAKLQIDHWLKDISPSSDLRKWFGHDPERWEGFQKAYRKELAGEPEGLQTLREAADNGKITLVFAAKDREHNNAVVLKQLLEEG